MGVGFKWNGFQLNVAYADVFEPGRSVAPGTGQIRPIDGAAHGAGVDSNGSPLPAVNEGQYAGHTDVFSFSVVAVFDEILGTPRSKTWGPKPAAAPARPKEPKVDEEPKKHPEPETKNDPPSSPPGKKSDWND